MDAPSTAALSGAARQAKDALDAWVREVIDWHFDAKTGCPFWLDHAATLGWDPRREIRGFDDLRRFVPFEDEWLRGGPVQRWVPKGLVGKPVFVFETGGTTGTPKTRVASFDQTMIRPPFPSVSASARSRARPRARSRPSARSKRRSR